MATGRRRRRAATLLLALAASAAAAAARPERPADVARSMERPPSRRTQHQASRRTRGASRRLQSEEEEETTTTIMEGTCSGSKLEAGQQRGRGSFLCYPPSNPMYKFGIDSSSRLAYYAASPSPSSSTSSSSSAATVDRLVWHAAPPPPDTPACVVFGHCAVPMHFFRVRASGDLVGFTPERERAWESHDDERGEGAYSDWATDELGLDDEGEDARIADMRPGSVLEVTDEGVLIYDDTGNERVVTWRLRAPQLETTTEATESPTREPTKAPVAEAATAPPTIRPTTKPTTAPTSNKDKVTVSGTLFFDSDNDGLVDAVDADRPPPPSAVEALQLLNQIVVDLYDCASDEWILITRASSSDGTYEFAIPLAGGGTTTDVAGRLDELGVTQIRAEFALPRAAAGSYEFVSPSKDSDVDPATGRTACWDLDVDGRGDVVWNAGMQQAEEDTLDALPAAEPAASPTPAMTPAPIAAAPTGGIVGGYAFLDVDDDGRRDPDNAAEPAVADAEVRLFSCTPNPSGAQGFAATAAGGGGGETLLGVQQTNDQGFYSFRNLFSGKYRVKVVPPPGHRISSAWAGGTDATDAENEVDNAVDPETGGTECFPLAGGATDLRWDVGLVPAAAKEESDAPTPSPAEQTPAAVAGFVFHDANNDGYLDDGEAALPNVQAALFDCDGNIIKLSTTDENGMYGFEAVPPGKYEVRFSLDDHRPSDVWTGTIDEEGKLAAPDAQNDADPSSGSTACREYGPGETVLDVDAGLIVIPEGETASPAASTVAPPNAAPSSKPTTARPTVDPKGDGTKCSGAKCSTEGHCRNKAGLCGAGIGFCNPASVWDASCPEKEGPAGALPTAAPGTEAPTGSLRPTAAPTISSNPTISTSPTATGKTESPIGDVSLPTGAVCNDDGSYGVASAPVASAASIAEVEFTYALKSLDGTAPGPNLVASFEAQLNDRLACAYFDDDCLRCEGSRARLRGRRRVQEEDSVIGLSSLPKDLLNVFEVCSGSATTNDCRVINGKFTAYFPMGTSQEELDAATARMLDVVQRELEEDNWEGLQVSYDNAPFPSPVEEGETGGEGGGASAGAIVGIVIAVLVVMAVVAAAVIIVIRRKREKDEEEFARQPHRAVPFGDSMSLASKGDDSDDSDSEESSSSSSSGDSSSSEGTDTFEGRNSQGASTAVSGDTYPTNVAQARSVDIEDDESGSYSVSEDEESYDEESESGEQQSAANDENAAVQYAGEYAPANGQAYDYDGQAKGGGYDDGQRGMQDTDDAGSMFSDPPGTSYRDLPREDEPGYDEGQYSQQVYDETQYGQDGPEQHPLQRMNQHSSNGSFRIYESETNLMADESSYHSFGNQADDVQSNPGSYQSGGHGSQHSRTSYERQGSQHSMHSHQSYNSQGSRQSRSSHSRHSQEEILQQQGYGDAQYSQAAEQAYENFRQQSFHSARSNQGSVHSGHSGRSFHSEASRQSGRSSHSRHSQEEILQEQSYDEAQYSQADPQQQAYDDGSQYSAQRSFHSQGSRSARSTHSRHSQEEIPQQQGYGDSNEGQYSQQYEEQYSQDFPQQQAYDDGSQYSENYHQQPGYDGGQYGQEAQYNAEYDQYAGRNAYEANQMQTDGQFGGGGTNEAYDEASYHSFNPVHAPPRPEELDEVSHAGSAYTAATRPVSNVSSPMQPPKQSARPEAVGEEEESINHIFKSLSDIQSRLSSQDRFHEAYDDN